MALPSVRVSVQVFAKKPFNLILQAVHKHNKCSIFCTVNFEGYIHCNFYIKTICMIFCLLFIFFKFYPGRTTNMMPFCLAANVYNEFVCFIAGTLSMFSARGCVPVSSLGSVRGNTVPRVSIDPYTPWEQGWDWILWSLLIISFNIIPVASGYEEIHLYSGMNIDNVKINTSLIMMKEWISPPSTRRKSANGFVLVPLISDTG